MADGVSHGIITKRVAVILGVATLFVTLSPLKAALSFLGAMLGLYVDPDLDIDGLTMSERRVLNSLGGIGWLWVAYWYPYSKAVSHRSVLSHMPFVGTAIRLVYLLFPLLIALWVSGASAYVSLNAGQIWRQLEWAILGLCMADIGHWIADWRVWRKVWKKHTPRSRY